MAAQTTAALRLASLSAIMARTRRLFHLKRVVVMKLSLRFAAGLVCCLAIVGCGTQATPTPKPAPAATGSTTAVQPEPAPHSEQSNANDSGKTVEPEPSTSENPPAVEKPTTPEKPTATDKPTTPSPSEKDMAMVKTESFGKTKEGQEVTLFTCTNKNGLVLKMI